MSHLREAEHFTGESDVKQILNRRLTSAMEARERGGDTETALEDYQKAMEMLVYKSGENADSYINEYLETFLSVSAYGEAPYRRFVAHFIEVLCHTHTRFSIKVLRTLRSLLSDSDKQTSMFALSACRVVHRRALYWCSVFQREKQFAARELAQYISSCMMVVVETIQTSIGRRFALAVQCGTQMVLSQSYSSYAPKSQTFLEACGSGCLEDLRLEDVSNTAGGVVGLDESQLKTHGELIFKGLCDFASRRPELPKVELEGLDGEIMTDLENQQSVDVQPSKRGTYPRGSPEWASQIRDDMWVCLVHAIGTIGAARRQFAADSMGVFQKVYDFLLAEEHHGRKHTQVRRALTCELQRLLSSRHALGQQPKAAALLEGLGHSQKGTNLDDLVYAAEQRRLRSNVLHKQQEDRNAKKNKVACSPLEGPLSISKNLDEDELWQMPDEEHAVALTAVRAKQPERLAKVAVQMLHRLPRELPLSRCLERASRPVGLPGYLVKSTGGLQESKEDGEEEVPEIENLNASMYLQDEHFDSIEEDEEGVAQMADEPSLEENGKGKRKRTDDTHNAVDISSSVVLPSDPSGQLDLQCLIFENFLKSQERFENSASNNLVDPEFAMKFQNSFLAFSLRMATGFYLSSRTQKKCTEMFLTHVFGRLKSQRLMGPAAATPSALRIQKIGAAPSGKKGEEPVALGKVEGLLLQAGIVELLEWRHKAEIFKAETNREDLKERLALVSPDEDQFGYTDTFAILLEQIGRFPESLNVWLMNEGEDTPPVTASFSILGDLRALLLRAPFVPPLVFDFLRSECLSGSQGGRRATLMTLYQLCCMRKEECAMSSLAVLIGLSVMGLSSPSVSQSTQKPTSQIMQEVRQDTLNLFLKRLYNPLSPHEAHSWQMVYPEEVPGIQIHVPTDLNEAMTFEPVFDRLRSSAAELVMSLLICQLASIDSDVTLEDFDILGKVSLGNECDELVREVLRSVSPQPCPEVAIAERMPLFVKMALKRPAMLHILNLAYSKMTSKKARTLFAFEFGSQVHELLVHEPKTSAEVEEQRLAREALLTSPHLEVFLQKGASMGAVDLAISFLTALSGIFLPLDEEEPAQVAETSFLPPGFSHCVSSLLEITGDLRLLVPGVVILDEDALVAKGGLLGLLTVPSDRLLKAGLLRFATAAKLPNFVSKLRMRHVLEAILPPPGIPMARDLAPEHAKRALDKVFELQAHFDTQRDVGMLLSSICENAGGSPQGLPPLFMRLLVLTIKNVPNMTAFIAQDIMPALRDMRLWEVENKTNWQGMALSLHLLMKSPRLEVRALACNVLSELPLQITQTLLSVEANAFFKNVLREWIKTKPEDELEALRNLLA